MNESMKDLKKFWWAFYLVLAIIFVFLFGSSNAIFGWVFGLDSIFIFWFMIVPLFFIIGLIFNIIKNNQNKKSVFRDWKFWVWLIPIIICFIIVMYGKFATFQG